MNRSRLRDYTLILVLGLWLFLPGLGSFALWDDDEAHNAECAREMAEAGTWVVPYFNFKLRTDKPALLYWCLLLSYQCFGVQEWAARLPSVLVSIGSLLVTYELGRLWFGRRTGLLAAAVLGSSIMFNVVSHAVTPDALLIFCTLLSFLCLAHGYAGSMRWWLVGAGMATGFAVLAKGPVGVALPGTVALLFLLWERRLQLLRQRQLLVAIAVFLAVAVPWYLMVGLTTHWEFTRGFFLKHNLSRFSEPMEGHRGPFFYHPVVLLATFAPWSAFLGLTLWYGIKGARRSAETAPTSEAAWPYRFLWCWVCVWLLFFSMAATKLPNYVLPIYPALALLTSRFLVRWWEGSIQPAPWLMHVALACFALVGMALSGGLLLASGWLDIPKLAGRELPGVAPLALMGLLPLLGALLCWHWLRHERRTACITALSLASVLTVGLMAAWGPGIVDASRAAKPLVQAMQIHQVEREVQIGCHPSYYRPGVVFYSRREVQRLMTDQQAIDLLRSPLQAYLLIAVPDWERIAPSMDTPYKLIGRHRDTTAGKEVLLITNRTGAPVPAPLHTAQHREDEPCPPLWFSSTPSD